MKFKEAGLMGFSLFLVLLFAVYLLHCSTGQPAVPVIGVSDRHAATAESTIIVLQVRSIASMSRSPSTSDAGAPPPPAAELQPGAPTAPGVLRSHCWAERTGH